MSAPKNLYYISDWKRIKDAYVNGKNAYNEYKKAGSAKNASGVQSI